MTPFKLISKCRAIRYEAAELQAELAREHLHKARMQEMAVRKQLQALQNAYANQQMHARITELSFLFMLLAIALYILYQYVRTRYN